MSSPAPPPQPGRSAAPAGDETTQPAEVGPPFFDRSGRPVSLERYCELHADLAYRIIERTPAGRFDMITVWMGTDRGFSAGDEPPLIFGTIGYDQPAGTYTDDLETFATDEETARADHRRLIERLTQA